MKEITRERRDKACKMFESLFGRGIDLNNYHVVLFGYKHCGFEDSLVEYVGDILHFNSTNVFKLTAKSIEEAMNDSLEIYTRERMCSSNVHIDSCEKMIFVPQGVSIFDDLCDLHAIFSCDEWVAPFSSKNEIKAAFEKADALDKEAAYESGWDNADTARRPRSKATALRARARLPIRSIHAHLIHLKRLSGRFFWFYRKWFECN